MENKNYYSNFRFYLSLVILCGGLFSIGTWSSDAKNPQTGLEMKATQVDRQSIRRVPNLAPRPEKQIGYHSRLPNMPVEITELKIKGTPIQMNSRVIEGTDWMEGLSFKVKNISNKNVAYLALYFIFPETSVDQEDSPIGYLFKYGSDPKVYGISIQEKPITPSQEIEFSVSGNTYEKIKKLIGLKTEPENINVLAIDVAMVVFDDDTSWAKGSFMRRDPNNPKKWIGIN